MANPLPASFLNFPIVDPKTGQATVDFTRWLNQVISQLANLNLSGNLNAGSGQQIDPATLAKQIANLDSQGIVMPNGIDLSRSYVNKYLDYINDGTNGGRFANRWFFLQAGTSTQWFKLGTWVAGNSGDVLRLDYAGGAGYNTNSVQQAYAEIVVRSGNDTAAPNLSGISWYQNGGTQPIIAIKAAATGGSTAPNNRSWDIYVELAANANGQFEAILSPGSTFTFSGASASDPGGASSTVVVGTGGAILGPGGTGLDAVFDGANGGRFANRWFFLSAGTSTQWFKLGTWVAGNYGDVLRLDYAGGAGFNTNSTQQAYAEIVVRSGNNTAAPNLSGISWYQNGGSQPIMAVKAGATGGSTSPSNQSWDIYVQLAANSNGHFEAILTPNSTFTFSGASASDPGAASSTVVVGTGGSILGSGGTGLDAVFDGGTYLRMPGSNMDANRRGLIDFTQTGHLGKVLDNIGDGTNYARPLAYSLYQGNPSYRTSRAAILSLSPTHYWPMDNGNLLDIGSSPSNLSYTGTVQPSGTSLAPGDPVVGMATANSSSALWGNATAATTWTIMSWVMPGSYVWANPSGIIGRSGSPPFGSPGSNEPHLYVDGSGYVYAAIWNGSVVVIKSSYAPNWNIPHHLAVTLGSGTLTLYIDGIQAAQASGLATDSPGTESVWTIGACYGGSGWTNLPSGWNANSNGTNFQDVVVWEGTALTQAQIQSIVVSGGGMFTSLSSVLDDYYVRMPGSNMDASRRALIDFSQGGHINKNSDYIPSGTNTIIPTQTRVNNSIDTSGNLLFKNTTTVQLTNGTAISSSRNPIPPSITITTHGKPVLIMAMVAITAGTQAGASVIPYIFRDGSALAGSATTGTWWFSAGASDTKTFIYLDDAPSAGSHTYELYGLAGGSVGSTVTGGFLTVFEFA